MSTDFSEISYEVSKNFLQTAIIIDDRFNFEKPKKIEQKNIKAPGRKNTSEKEDLSMPSKDLKGSSLNAMALINSFADQGIICAALDFNNYSSDSNKFLKTAKRADIVILDWEMEEGKTGENALKLISELLESEFETPQRYRLISIYTGTSDLHKIKDEVQIKIKDDYEVDLKFDASDLSLKYNSIVIQIFAKETTHVHHDFKENVVMEKDLPIKLVSSFSESVNGILPNTALFALTALRDNSHRLIGQFDKRLDAAYLSHKILSNPPDDAENQLVQLIASEIGDILNEYNVASYADGSSIEAWINQQHKLGLPIRTKMRFRENTDIAKKELLKLINKGITKAKIRKKNKTFSSQISAIKNEKDKALLSELTGFFMNNSDEAENIDRDFARMLSCKTFYKGTEPVIEPGVILKSKGHNKFYICIQPACDSVRISVKGRDFLFLPLEKDDKKFNINITTETLGPLNLKVNTKSYLIKLFKFAPEKKNTPIRAKKINDKWFFKSLIKENSEKESGNDKNDVTEFEWIATVKNEIALKLAHEYVTNVSRVGIVESEWQRRWAK